MNYLFCISLVILIMPLVTSDCPDHCVCKVTDIKCYKTLSSFIPENVTSVTALEVPLEPYMNFTYTDWHSVTNLSLSLGPVVNETKSLPERRLQEYEFVGLMNLQHLKLLCHCLLSVNSSAFYGLTNVTLLDLSNNHVSYYSLTYGIVTGLQGDDILPNISELYLSNIKRRYVPTISLYLFLDDLHTAMENKPLRVLDLSGTSFYFYISHSLTPPPSLLPQLHTLNISRAGPAVFSLSDVYQYYTQRPEAVFSNLQVLDASYPYVPQSQSECEKSANYIYWQFCKISQHMKNFLPSNLTELHMKNIFGSKVSHLGGFSNSSYLTLNTTIFDTNRSISVQWHPDYLQELDISENSFTYIEPELIRPMKSLKYLDMSNNKLGPSLADVNYARKFFHAAKRTEVILFSNNSLTSFPSGILRSNNKLRILDLSHNQLTSVGIGLKGQVALELLDLSFNRIVSIDSAGCELIKNLHFSFNTSTTISKSHNKVGLVLDGNPLSCSCQNLCVFKVLQEQNKTLTCSLNDNNQRADFLHLKQLDYSCKQGVFIAAISVDGLFTLILTFGLVHYLKKEWIEIKRRRAIKKLNRKRYRKEQRNAVTGRIQSYSISVAQ